MVVTKHYMQLAQLLLVDLVVAGVVRSRRLAQRGSLGGERVCESMVARSLKEIEIEADDDAC